MPECECLYGCPFFNDKLQTVPAIAKEIKEKYCLGNNELCARYMVFKALGSKKVPSDLFPVQTDRAHKLIAV